MRICVAALQTEATQAVPKKEQSIFSLMVVRLYSVLPTGAGSGIFTSIDFLSSLIWKNMAHMPGGDTATKLDYLSS